MKMRGWILSIFLMCPFFLPAQAPDVAVAAETAAPAVPFPLTLVLEAAYGDAHWRPDWPLEMPPDSFTVKGRASRITVELGPLQDAGAGDEAGLVPAPRAASRYLLARDARGRLTDFPLVLPASAASSAGPVLAQATARYHAEGGVTGLTVILPSSLTWTAQFPAPYMPGEGTPPAKPDEAVKVQSGEQVFYVLFSEGGNEIAETWFDPWGTFVAYFKTRIERAPAAGAPWRIRSQEGAHFRRDYYYENGGDLSRYAGDDGDFSIFYSARRLPLFWTSTPGTAAGGTGILPETGIFSFQWDEQGQLVRLRDLSPAGPDTGEGIVISPGAAPAGDAAEADVEPPPVPVDFRYEYEFDARGNWVLRREIALYRRDGLLLPAYSREISRRIIQEE